MLQLICPGHVPAQVDRSQEEAASDTERVIDKASGTFRRPGERLY